MVVSVAGFVIITGKGEIEVGRVKQELCSKNLHKLDDSNNGGSESHRFCKACHLERQRIRLRRNRRIKLEERENSLKKILDRLEREDLEVVWDRIALVKDVVMKELFYVQQLRERMEKE